MTDKDDNRKHDEEEKETDTETGVSDEHLEGILGDEYSDEEEDDMGFGHGHSHDDEDQGGW
jgi:hypothetical protein